MTPVFQGDDDRGNASSLHDVNIALRVDVDDGAGSFSGTDLLGIWCLRCARFSISELKMLSRVRDVRDGYNNRFLRPFVVKRLTSARGSFAEAFQKVVSEGVRRDAEIVKVVSLMRWKGMMKRADKLSFQFSE